LQAVLAPAKDHVLVGRYGGAHQSGGAWQSRSAIPGVYSSFRGLPTWLSPRPVVGARPASAPVLPIVAMRESGALAEGSHSDSLRQADGSRCLSVPGAAPLRGHRPPRDNRAARPRHAVSRCMYAPILEIEGRKPPLRPSCACPDNWARRLPRRWKGVGAHVQRNREVPWPTRPNDRRVSDPSGCRARRGQARRIEWPGRRATRGRRGSRGGERRPGR